MSKFKIDDKVNVEYSPNCFIKCKVLKVFHKHYDLQVLEDGKGLSKDDRFTFHEGCVAGAKDCLQNKQTLDYINCKYDTQNEYEYVCMDTGDFKIMLGDQTTYLCKRHLLSFLLESSSMKFIIEKI